MKLNQIPQEDVNQIPQEDVRSHFAHGEYFIEWEAMYFQKLQEQGKLPTPLGSTSVPGKLPTLLGSTSVPVGKKQDKDLDAVIEKNAEAQKFLHMASLLVHEVYKLDDATWCSIS